MSDSTEGALFEFVYACFSCTGKALDDYKVAKKSSAVLPSAKKSKKRCQ